MSQKIEEYKKKKISEIELPSGLKVKIKDITPFTFLRIQQELNIPPTSEQFYSFEMVEKLFENFMVEPAINTDFNIEDFNREDYIFLHDLIFDKILISMKEEEDKK